MTTAASNPFPTGEVKGTATVPEPDHPLNGWELIVEYAPVFIFWLQITNLVLLFLLWRVPAERNDHWMVKPLKYLQVGMKYFILAVEIGAGVAYYWLEFTKLQ
jgi:hypothetical protein